MNNSRLATIDMAHGVDFERARERLSQLAAVAMRRYRLANHSGTATDVALEELRSEVVDARERARALRPSDDVAIAEILRG